MFAVPAERAKGSMSQPEARCELGERECTVGQKGQ